MKRCTLANWNSLASGASSKLSAWIDAACSDASRQLDARCRAEMGQYLTRRPIAAFMASMIKCEKREVRVLDPGAGTGSLSAALVLAMCHRQNPPNSILLSAYEIDPVLIRYLRKTIELCQAACDESGVAFDAQIISEDFLEMGANTFAGHLFSNGEKQRFDCAIMNPPYRKIRAQSRERMLLRAMGVESTNLYAGFLAITSRLLAPCGEMVAITPRSFCNGPYFERFRRFFLKEMRFRRIHVFDTRNRAFAEDKVLQENVLFRAEKTKHNGRGVVVSASVEPDDNHARRRTIAHDELVYPHDSRAVIHIIPEVGGDLIRRRIESFSASLSDLGLSVSTGRLVAYRAKERLREKCGHDTVPLIHPRNLRSGFVEWPCEQLRKPRSLAVSPDTKNQLVPFGYYVLTKRFSAKEERRRIVAAVYDPTRVTRSSVAFENHLNFYHLSGCGMAEIVAKGLVVFLNSTLVDSFFRQFSGHTQVNASDLRRLRYPTYNQLIALGSRIGERFPAQQELDLLVEEFLPGG